MDQYFGGGERVQPPSKGGTPVHSILLRRPTKTPECARKTDNTIEPQLTQEWLENAEEGAVANANTVVDLEGFTTELRPKGGGSRKRDKRGKEERATEEQANKTKARKPTITFGPTEVVKEKPIAYKECVVGFAIRVDKGNNTKAAFDKKLMEGLTFIQQYVDKRECFLPHEKDCWKMRVPVRHLSSSS